MHSGVLQSEDPGGVAVGSVSFFVSMLLERTLVPKPGAEPKPGPKAKASESEAAAEAPL